MNHAVIQPPQFSSSHPETVVGDIFNQCLPLGVEKWKSIVVNKRYNNFECHSTCLNVGTFCDCVMFLMTQ